MTYVDYFQNKEGFSRFFAICLEKYQRSGKVVGLVRIPNISEVEAQTFTSFFARKFYAGQDYTISVKEFLKILGKGRFSDFDFLTYFSCVYDGFTLETNREKRTKKLEAYYSFLADTLAKFQYRPLQIFLAEQLTSKTQTMNLIKRKYSKSKKQCEKELLNIDRLLTHIPNEITFLPIYASLTGNPHYLDLNSSEGNLFYRLLAHVLEEEVPKTVEEKIHLLEEINVYTDPLSNFVIVHNLVYSFDIPFKTMNLNMENIEQLNEVQGYKNCIFVFENPSILNHLKSLNLSASVIITSGNLNLSFYKLIEKISDDTTIYYNGDFDPEGLLIAEKLKKKRSNIIFFGYEKKNYLMTHPVKDISQKRLRKLEHVTSKEFQEVKQCILESHKAGYQENQLKFIEEYVRDIIEHT